MKRLKEKSRKSRRRAHRVRTKVQGTAKRPRLSVFRSSRHIKAQLIDDVAGKTLASASDYDIKDKLTGAKLAEAVGKELAARAAKKKISTAVFDRGPYAYHGRVKAVAEGARNNGLKF